MRAAASVAVLLALLTAVAPASAEDAPAAPSPRAGHFWLGAGGLGVQPGFGSGFWLGVGVGPSGTRWGARLDAFVFGTAADSAVLAASATYQGARTGKHFVIELHFGGALRVPDTAPMVTAGVASRLGLLFKRRVYLGLDGSLQIAFDDLPLDVALVTVLSVGAQW